MIIIATRLLIVLACIDNIFLVLTILDYSVARGQT